MSNYGINATYQLTTAVALAGPVDGAGSSYAAAERHRLAGRLTGTFFWADDTRRWIGIQLAL
ncbi:hypothetical protein [Caballeronia sp. S22]|uniref:hypothetical protein n=1 Tax=Caballeronia sp. S22 TaxID=3137182 RepID=UPI0035310C0D